MKAKNGKQICGKLIHLNFHRFFFLRIFDKKEHKCLIRYLYGNKKTMFKQKSFVQILSFDKMRTREKVEIHFIVHHFGNLLAHSQLRETCRDMWSRDEQKNPNPPSFSSLFFYLFISSLFTSAFSLFHRWVHVFLKRKNHSLECILSCLLVLSRFVLLGTKSNKRYETKSLTVRSKNVCRSVNKLCTTIDRNYLFHTFRRWVIVFCCRCVLIQVNLCHCFFSSFFFCLLLRFVSMAFSSFQF